VQWNEELPLGEQQRLGMARLMFHKPRYAVLDECTSGVTTDMEARFTDILKRLGCTCITISHRPALVAFHDLVLALDGDGGWQLLPGQRGRGASGRRGSGEHDAAVRQIAAGDESERAADARFVNAHMSGAAGMSAAEEEGGAQRTVLDALLPKPHEAETASASDDMHVALMAERLHDVRQAASGRSLPQQWREVTDVLFARSSGWALVRQFAGIGAIVLARTLLQVRPGVRADHGWLTMCPFAHSQRCEACVAHHTSQAQPAVHFWDVGLCRSSSCTGLSVHTAAARAGPHRAPQRPHRRVRRPG
jgi:hypothetical protein